MVGGGGGGGGRGGRGGRGGHGEGVVFVAVAAVVVAFDHCLNIHPNPTLRKMPLLFSLACLYLLKMST